MAMVPKKTIIKNPKTGRSMYPVHTSDEFETIEQVAGYSGFPYKLTTMSNGSVYVGEIHGLKDVERLKHSIIHALSVHKKLKAHPIPKKK